MIAITNKLFQPLTFQREGMPEGLHLGPRERQLLPVAEISEEMRRAERRGYITLHPLTMSATTDLSEGS